MGISYAIVSSSWDPEVFLTAWFADIYIPLSESNNFPHQIPGSALGIEEFKINLQRIKDGLSRTKETAELREEIEKQSQQKTRK